MSISKEKILIFSREIVAEEGLNALSIRKLASRCDLAVGSIYNYFPSKDDLLIETIESVWEDIFRIDDKSLAFNDFIKYIDHVLDHLISGIKKYPNFFNIHSLSFKSKNKDKAKSSMDVYLEKLKKEMICALNEDKKIKQATFNDTFSKDDLIKYILTTSICFIVDKNYDKDLFLKVIEKIIY